MKRIFTTGIIFAVLAFCSTAHAASSGCLRIDEQEQQCYDDPNPTSAEVGCRTGSLQGTDSACYYNCTSCESGYTLVSRSSRGYTYKKCVLTDCISCESDANWSSAATGAEKYTSRFCDPCYGCIEETQYRCIAGYYGNDGNCTPCPGSGTSAIDSTDVTKCYLPAGTGFSDSTGTGTYSANCYYTN